MLLRPGRKLQWKSFQWHFLESTAEKPPRSQAGRGAAQASSHQRGLSYLGRQRSPSQDPAGSDRRAGSSHGPCCAGTRGTRLAGEEWFFHPEQVV